MTERVPITIGPYLQVLCICVEAKIGIENCHRCVVDRYTITIARETILLASSEFQRAAATSLNLIGQQQTCFSPQGPHAMNFRNIHKRWWSKQNKDEMQTAEASQMKAGKEVMQDCCLAPIFETVCFEASIPLALLNFKKW